MISRLPALDPTPFAAPGGADNLFLGAIVRRVEPGRGLPAVPVAVVSKRYQLLGHEQAADAVGAALGAIGVHPSAARRFRRTWLPDWRVTR